jgi:hypothetical protein
MVSGHTHIFVNHYLTAKFRVITEKNEVIMNRKMIKH